MQMVLSSVEIKLVRSLTTKFGSLAFSKHDDGRYFEHAERSGVVDSESQLELILISPTNAAVSRENVATIKRKNARDGLSIHSDEKLCAPPDFVNVDVCIRTLV
mmetsp:Transcript_15248/g.36586  ORF Transcript_15248/g.36586 Transcript_15248/m.36586 type:complete len:104 (-) Transcript_15248:1021-1332(-)